MDEASSQGTWFRFSTTMFRDWFRLILPNPSWGGHSADHGEKREPRETALMHYHDERSVMKELDATRPR